jgi:hypothetical protein
LYLPSFLSSFLPSFFPFILPSYQQTLLMPSALGQAGCEIPESWCWTCQHHSCLQGLTACCGRSGDGDEAAPCQVGKDPSDPQKSCWLEESQGKYSVQPLLS